VKAAIYLLLYFTKCSNVKLGSDICNHEIESLKLQRLLLPPETTVLI